MPQASGLSRRTSRTVAIVLSGSILFAAGASYATATAVTAQIKHVNVFGPLINRPLSDGGENILLVGSDDRTGLTKKERRQLHVGQGDYGRHTDSIMIVHIAHDGSVGVVSLPRDSDVQIPSYTDSNHRTHPAHRDKINAAYMYGGPALTVETVEANTGVHIDHYAEINFAGFVNMVDALGGVPVCFKQPVKDTLAGLNLPAGETVLDGKQALAYVRARHIDATSDYGRMNRQQSFLGSVFNQVISPAVVLNPPRLVAFLNSAASAVTTDDGFGQGELWGLVARMRGLSPSSISFQTVPTSGTNSAANEVWDSAKAAALFAKLKTGAPLVDPPKAAAPSVKGKSPAPVPAPSSPDAPKTAADPICG